MSRFFSWTWGAWKWIVLARERQHRTHAAIELVAAELDAHAETIRTTGASGYSQGFLPPSLDIQFDAWLHHRTDLFRIAKKDRQLWLEIQEMYAELQRRAKRGGSPPSPEAVEDLARRLRERGF